jgi:hypothetical protein
MSNTKQLKKFCKISKYIEQTDKDLFGVIDDLCLYHLLKPSRGSNGITFLFPNDKAYRQKIVKLAYSNEPDVAIKMLKTLILQDYYPTISSFGNGAINLLNQKLDIKSSSEKEITLGNGLEIKTDSKFVPMGYRDNMAVYELSGKGEMPMDGAVVAIPSFDGKKNASKTGGFSGGKHDLQKFLEKTYIAEIGQCENIYVKKVYLQLKFLEAMRENGTVHITDHLGNDEFSDSYLLDMYCENKFPASFSLILKTLTDSLVIKNITKDKYQSIKAKFCDAPGNTYAKSPNRLNRIQSPMDIRVRVHDLYKNDKAKIGKDLFIVFCNIQRDIWFTENNDIESFKTFAYIAAHVYTATSDILNSGFDIARDLSLYGNLLKSDVFMYSPQAAFNQGDVSLPIPTSMPSPLDMSLYSLCGYVNTLCRKNISGGSHNSEIAFLIEGL